MADKGGKETTVTVTGTGFVAGEPETGFGWDDVRDVTAWYGAQIESYREAVETIPRAVGGAIEEGAEAHAEALAAATAAYEEAVGTLAGSIGEAIEELPEVAKHGQDVIIGGLTTVGLAYLAFATVGVVVVGVGATGLALYTFWPEIQEYRGKKRKSG